MAFFIIFPLLDVVRGIKVAFLVVSLTIYGGRLTLFGWRAMMPYLSFLNY